MRFLLAKLGLGDLKNDPGVRAISWQTLIGRIGAGLFMTIEVIYFRKIIGFSATEISIALGVGGAVMLLMAVPSGMAADRFGAKRVMFVGAVLEAFFMLCLIWVREFPYLIVVNILVSTFGTMFHNASSAVISVMGDGEERVSIRAVQRAMANMGIGIGTVLAGIALYLNTLIAYQVTLTLNFVLLILAALYIKRLPPAPATVKKGDPVRFVALKDWKFLAATLLNGVVGTHFVLQGVALPLWILHYTKVPAWWISVLFVINTVVVTLLQVQVSKGGGDLRSSAKKFRLGTVYLLGCCLVYSVSGHLDPWLTGTILVIGMLIHTIGELYTAAGSWTIGFELAVEEHMGQYQGVYSLGWGLGGTFGPYAVTALAIGLGMTGWWIIGVAFLIAGLLMNALIRGHSAVQKQA